MKDVMKVYNMKKNLFGFMSIAAFAVLFVLSACGGGGGSGGSDEEVLAEIGSGFVKVDGSTVVGAISGSEVFIENRTVIIPTLWACDHELTQEEYGLYCNFAASMASNTSEQYFMGNKYPACVSWYDALVYCNKRSLAEGLSPCYSINGKTNPGEWGEVPVVYNDTWNAVSCNFNANGYRLPTEAEWEYLARGGNTSNSGQTVYSGSDDIDSVAWYTGNSQDEMQEVKKKAPNAKGLYDMSGNAYEWCWDWYGDIIADTPKEGVEAALSNSERVFRSGCFGDGHNSSSVSRRHEDPPQKRCNYIGFRLVRTCSE